MSNRMGRSMMYKGSRVVWGRMMDRGRMNRGGMNGFRRTICRFRVMRGSICRFRVVRDSVMPMMRVR